MVNGENLYGFASDFLDTQADFSTGALNHTLVGGVELSSETSR